MRPPCLPGVSCRKQQQQQQQEQQSGQSLQKELESIADDIVKGFENQMSEVGLVGGPWRGALYVGLVQEDTDGPYARVHVLRVRGGGPGHSSPPCTPSLSLSLCCHTVHGTPQRSPLLPPAPAPAVLPTLYYAVLHTQVMDNLAKGEMALDDLNGAHSTEGGGRQPSLEQPVGGSPLTGHT